MTKASKTASPPLRAPALRAICDVTERVTRFAIGTLVGIIVAITIVSVWYRYGLDNPLSWSEQVSRILFVWVTFLGTALLYRHMLHIAIDMMVVMLPQPMQKALYWINQGLVLVFALLMLWFGGLHSINNMGQTFGALEISPSTFYSAAPVSAILILLYWVEKLFDPTFRAPHGEVHF